MFIFLLLAAAQAFIVDDCKRNGELTSICDPLNALPKLDIEINATNNLIFNYYGRRCGRCYKYGVLILALPKQKRFTLAKFGQLLYENTKTELGCSTLVLLFINTDTEKMFVYGLPRKQDLKMEGNMTEKIDHALKCIQHAFKPNKFDFGLLFALFAAAIVPASLLSCLMCCKRTYPRRF